jgi:hypothetical protein
MTTQRSTRSFRLLPLGGAKARTNDDSGQLKFEDATARYNHN